MLYTLHDICYYTTNRPQEDPHILTLSTKELPLYTGKASSKKMDFID